MNTSRLSQHDRGLAEWLEAVCKHIEKDARRGNYALLRNLGPGMAHFYESVYSKRGGRVSFNYWRGVYEPFYRDVQALYQTYNARLAERNAAAEKELTDFREALNGISDMTLDEIEGLIDFIRNHISKKEQAQRAVAEMSAEELVGALAQLETELKTRRAAMNKAKAESEAKAQQQQREDIAQKVTAGILMLSEQYNGKGA